MRRLTGAEPPRRRSLAEKLDHLFKTVQPASRGEYTYEEVAHGIRERGGPTISVSYIWQLRKGAKTNPTMRHLEALSSFFGVPPAYFFDEGITERIDAQLEMLAAMRDSGVQEVALRAAGLSSEALRAITGMIEHARQLEGLQDQGEAPEPGAGGAEG